MGFAGHSGHSDSKHRSPSSILISFDNFLKCRIYKPLKIRHFRKPILIIYHFRPRRSFWSCLELFEAVWTSLDLKIEKGLYRRLPKVASGNRPAEPLPTAQPQRLCAPMCTSVRQRAPSCTKMKNSRTPHKPPNPKRQTFQGAEFAVSCSPCETLA